MFSRQQHLPRHSGRVRMVFNGTNGHSKMPRYSVTFPRPSSYISRDVVVKAWAGMMDMARFANATLSLLLPDTAAYQLFQDQTIVVEGICQAMKKDPTRNTPAYLLCYRSFLAANNLAYGQLFAADTEQLPTSKSIVQFHRQFLILLNSYQQV